MDLGQHEDKQAEEAAPEDEKKAEEGIQKEWDAKLAKDLKALKGKSKDDKPKKEKA